MLILNIMLFVLLCCSFYVIYNLLNKVETYETFCESLYSNLDSVFKRIRDIDYRKSFESDDEVGFVYSAIRSTVNELKTFLLIEKGEDM